MTSYIPWGLYRPYASLRGTDTLGNILIPLSFLLSFAIISAIPIFQVKGVWLAALYVFFAFHILCFLRRWAMGSWSYQTEQGRYISPSLLGLAEIYSMLFPGFGWIGASFGIAHWLWGWTLAP